MTLGKMVRLIAFILLSICLLTGCRSGSAPGKEANPAETRPASATNEKESETLSSASAGEFEELSEKAEVESPFTIFLDDEIYTQPSVSPDSDDDVRVYITWNGYPLIDLPFGEAHTVLVHQVTGADNQVVLTGEAVYMGSANCDGQDCINMGEVTRENMETRVMGGFIICLPNMIVVEVRGQ